MFRMFLPKKAVLNENENKMITEVYTVIDSEAKDQYKKEELEAFYKSVKKIMVDHKVDVEMQLPLAKTLLEEVSNGIYHTSILTPDIINQEAKMDGQYDVPLAEYMKRVNNLFAVQEGLNVLKLKEMRKEINELPLWKKVREHHEKVKGKLRTKAVEKGLDDVANKALAAVAAFKKYR